MSLKTSFTFQAVDKVSAPVRRIGAGITSMASRAMSGFRGVGQAGQGATKAIAGMTDHVRRAGQALRSLENNPGLRSLKRLADAGGKSLGFAARKAMELGKWAGVALGAGIVGLGVGVFKAGIQYENFMSALEGTERSAAGAKRTMKFIQGFASDTGLSLEQATKAYLRLKGAGLENASKAALTAYGDEAASQPDKTMLDVIEAVADGVQGEFERLKEFSVKAKLAGSQVEFAYTGATGRTRKRVKNDAAEIEKALIGIFEDKSGGSMARRAGGLGQILTAMGDTWGRFLLRIGGGGEIGGENGVFGYIRRELAGINADLASDSTATKTAKLAKSISDGMIKAFETLKKAFANFDFGKFVADIATLVSAGAGLVKFLGGLGGVIDAVVVGGIVKIGWVVGSIATGIAAAFGVATAPIWGTVALITAVAAAGYLIVRHWKDIGAWWNAHWAQMTASISVQAGKWQALFTDMWAAAKTTFATGAAAIWNVLPTWLQGVIKGAVFVMKLTSPVAAVGAVMSVAKGGDRRATTGPRAATRASLARAAPAAVRPAMIGGGRSSPVQGGGAAQVGGRVEIELRDGRRSSVRKVSSVNPNVPLDVYRGMVGGLS